MMAGRSTCVVVFILVAFFGVFADKGLCATSHRERILLDFGWKFHLGDDFGSGENLMKAGVSTGPASLNFHDGNWRMINLPHDWAVELPFDSTADRSHGYKPLGPGFPANSVGWYRRSIDLPRSDSGKRIFIEFDGVFRDARVFVNGYRIAHHESGYHSFRCEISDVANYGGPNSIAVRVDASQFEGWFYEGAGIYRHVWLLKTAPIAIVPDGVHVTTSFSGNKPLGPALIQFSTELHNALRDAVSAKVKWKVTDRGGNSLCAIERKITIKGGATATAGNFARLTSPVLWSPESPTLYTLITTIESEGSVTDSIETQFGIRTIAFDPQRGFLLNGKSYPIRGTCNHQDHAGVGAAMPDALQDFRIARLKEMGCNAIRTSHNAPTQELLNACDRLGMLVMDETRWFGSDALNLGYLADQVRRDRNHPSVVIWSIANEEERQEESQSAAVAQRMQEVVHSLDSTRPCTAAMNGWSDSKPDGISIPIDVQGFNYYRNGNMDKFHEANPLKPCIGTEEASAFYTRGVYTNSNVYRSAYDVNRPGYGATAEEWVTYFAKRPWASGSFAWTGFDYRGEPSPFQWPNVSSEFGILDLCGFPKDAFYYYQSWWTDKPVLHILPDWNRPGSRADTVLVTCFSNCDEVELFLNGKTLGRKAMQRYSHLEWRVPYAPGVLLANGWKGGTAVVKDTVATTGMPSAIRLESDRSLITADGRDISIVTVAVTDENGLVVPTAQQRITYQLSGPGAIIGVGNGDPISHEPDVYLDKIVSHALPITDWRMKEIDSTGDLTIVSDTVDDSMWGRVDILSDASQLPELKWGAYRSHVVLSPTDLQSDEITLRFGMIDDDGWVYINGKPAGEAHDWSQDQYFPAKKFLTAGTNTIALLVKNNRGPGGINKGATVEFAKTLKSPPWQRSVFNGLGQVIIQSSQNAGEITLTATGVGLAQGQVSIRTTTGKPAEHQR